MVLIDSIQEVKKIGYETFDLLNGKKLKIFVPSGVEVLDFTADKDYIIQISIVIKEKA